MIASILLGALYLALNSTLEQTQSSRDAADVEDLSRGAFNRIAIDLSAVLGPLPPKIAGTAGASSEADTGVMMDTEPPADDGTDPEATTDPAMTGAANIPFHAGIIGVTDGERKYLVLFASRVPNVLSTAGALVQGTDITNNQQVPSDLRRIIYWKGANGGLCREERLWVTADGVGNSTTPDLSNEASNTIVDDVVTSTSSTPTGAAAARRMGRCAPAAHRQRNVRPAEGDQGQFGARISQPPAGRRSDSKDVRAGASHSDLARRHDPDTRRSGRTG